MRSALLSLPTDVYGKIDRRRTTGLAVALFAHLLALFLFFWLPSARQSGPKGEDLGAMQLLPQRASPEPERKKTVERQKKQDKVKAQQPPLERVPTPAVPVPAPFKLDILEVDLAASDISKLPKAAKDTGSETASADSGSSGAVATGPGGVRLYNAEWQTEPTDAQLAYYIPRGLRADSWALIACRTVAKYRVEDCVPLDESPVGSGLARGLVGAAWQFRVLPPRINGVPQVGEWVRIRFDITPRKK